MLPVEQRVSGIEDRHKYVAAGATIIHRRSYEQTGEIFVAMGHETMKRMIRVKPDKSQPIPLSPPKRKASLDQYHGRFDPLVELLRQEGQRSRQKLIISERAIPYAPKLQGQSSLIWETLKAAADYDVYLNGPRKAENLADALLRAIGQDNKVGEEVGGIYFNHPITHIHLNTIWFADDNRIPSGTENAVLANFLIFDETPTRKPFLAGRLPDMSEVRWFNLKDILDVKKAYQHTIIPRKSPDIIPDHPNIPVDSRVKRRVTNFTKIFFQQNKDIDFIDLEGIGFRPGNLQVLEDIAAALPPPEDLARFIASPAKFYQPNVHRKLQYFQHPELYEELVA